MSSSLLSYISPSLPFPSLHSLFSLFSLGKYEAICKTLRDMLRIVKPGGKVLTVYNHDRIGPDAPRTGPVVFPRIRVTECLGDIATVLVMPDAQFLGDNFLPYVENKLKPHGKTYTLILTKHAVLADQDAMREYKDKSAAANQETVAVGEKYMKWALQKLRL